MQRRATLGSHLPLNDDFWQILWQMGLLWLNRKFPLLRKDALLTLSMPCRAAAQYQNLITDNQRRQHHRRQKRARQLRPSKPTIESVNDAGSGIVVTVIENAAGG